MKVGSSEISSMGGRVVVGPRQQVAGAGVGEEWSSLQEEQHTRPL